MFVVQNKTPFAADAVLLPDSKGVMAVVTVIKATFSFSDVGHVTAAENQIPLCYTDEYWESSETSCLRYVSDMVCEKKGTDIAVNGHVYAPMRQPVERGHATVTVGTLKNTIVVWGDRFLSSTLGVATKTRPRPFVKMPLRYERAFGGGDKRHGIYRENPVGVGFASGSRSLKGKALPNFEHFETKGKKKTGPAGFGFIAPTWEPRAAFAGTYDKAWAKERMLLPPLDFDIRFNNAANPYLVTKKPLSGNEKVTLTNLHRSVETVCFQLPGLALKTGYIFEHETFKPPSVLDTLIIEPDENRFTLVYRTTYRGPMPWNQLIQVTIDDENKHS